MKLRKAATLDLIYQAFKGEPLQIEELDEFYQNAREARGGIEPRRRMSRLLHQLPDTSEHILFVGYKGCGKSTEMNHLQKDIQNEFLVINFSVQDELDPVHLNYIELFIVTMERLFSFAKENDLSVSEEYLQSIQRWLSTKEIEEIREKYNIGVEGEAGMEGNIGIPYLQKFFYKFKASAKSSRQLKETLKRNIEPKLSDLIEHCNDLIREVTLKLDTIGKKDLLLIIEDLDKIPLDRAEELFFNYTNQLTLLQTNVIFTFPIALYHNVRFNDIKVYFTNVYELPMIKIKNRDGSENEEGMNVMRKIVDVRMETEKLLESPEILNQMIRDSGGCMRDLFLMIREAADSALDFERKSITKEDRVRAYQKLKREYENNIADNFVDDKKYSAEDYYQTLIDLHENQTKKVDNTIEVMHLRQNLSILGYNGEGWCDVHPIVVDILKERGKIE
jgi:hypothetical protein